MTGKSGVGGDLGKAAANATEVHLQLAAGESVILRAFADKKVEGPAWNYWQTNGQPVEITGKWNVKFISGGPTLPADFQTTKLASWTTFPDTNARLSPAPRNMKSRLTRRQIPSNSKLKIRNSILDLGDVRQSARVSLNGKDYGTLITPPFRVVVDNLKPDRQHPRSGSHQRRRQPHPRSGPARREVENFHDINIVDINYKPFNAANWPLTDCGLLGPVTLTPVKAE